jgi:uncharacterized protein with ATP-grasp and redox domains
MHEDDPYRELKAQSNQLALEWLPGLNAKVRGAADPLEMAIRASIAGNIIDYGAKQQVTLSCIEDAMVRSLAVTLDADTLDAFRTEIAAARSILYLADNAGEIVFDRILIEQLPVEKVTVVVRGAPIINDATREDALAAGLNDLVDVVDNGTDIPGTVVDECSPEIQERFRTAEVVIAKGQGNYETLLCAGRPIYHLFVVKCPMVARLAGRPIDTPVFFRSEPVGDGGRGLTP